jgi:hypothetical protein
VPRFPIQAKLHIGRVNDPLEHEADRVASEAVRDSAGTARPRLHAGAAGDALEVDRTVPSPESFRGRGEALPAAERGFFERRFDYDFGSVRVHHDAEAAHSAQSIGARAYTYGRDIVFGRGEYARGSEPARNLLAHELTHVVQQGAGRPLVQRSLLSDSLRKTWEPDHKIEALLARLSASDMQTDAAHKDADIDTAIADLVKNADDLWVTQRIRQGKLGDTTGKFGPKVAGALKPRPVDAHFFRGSTDRRALVIAGVHGTEQQGTDVARMLIADLQKPATPSPVLTTIVVPSLFPDDAAAGTREAGGMEENRSKGIIPTNRNFPPASQNLAQAKAAGGGTAKDALGSEILPENLMLIELMERFRPERIISIHGTWDPNAAGVFYDKRSLRQDEVDAAERFPPRHARQQDDEGAGDAEMATRRALAKQRKADMLAQADRTDRDLSLKAATQIDTDATAVKGREGRGMGGDKAKHPSIAGNIGSTGKIDNPIWGGGTPGGVSLGGYAPARGMSVFTVEPPVDAPISDYPNAKDRASPKKIDTLTKADRITELQSYADAVRTVLLGT